MAVDQRAYPHPHVNDAWLARVREDILEPDLPIIDAHHHLWERASGVYLLPQLKADVTAGHNVRGTVFIQCGYGFRTDWAGGAAPGRRNRNGPEGRGRRWTRHLRGHHRLHRFPVGRSGRCGARSTCRGGSGAVPRHSAKCRLGSGDFDPDLGPRAARAARRPGVPGRSGAVAAVRVA